MNQAIVSNLAQSFVNMMIEVSKQNRDERRIKITWRRFLFKFEYKLSQANQQRQNEYFSSFSRDIWLCIQIVATKRTFWSCFSLIQSCKTMARKEWPNVDGRLKKIDIWVVALSIYLSTYFSHLSRAARRFVHFYMLLTVKWWKLAG